MSKLQLAIIVVAITILSPIWLICLTIGITVFAATGGCVIGWKLGELILSAIERG